MKRWYGGWQTWLEFDGELVRARAVSARLQWVFSVEGLDAEAVERRAQEFVDECEDGEAQGLTDGHVG